MAEYFERKALIERFKELGLGENSFMERIFADGVYSVLESFPSADVAPTVHGKWLDNERNGYGWAFLCSNCGWVDGFPFNDRYKYCPHCGAKMDKE